jgi:hypothetical protein
MNRLQCLLVLCTFLCTSPAMSHADTWLSTADHYSQPKNPEAGASMQLFMPGASWGLPEASIFKASTQFLLRAKDDELKSMLDALRQRHVSLAVEGLTLVYQEHCGRGIEGYENSAAIPEMAERVKRAGGTVAYVAMDEPIWMGSHAIGQGFCHDSVESVAEQLAPNVRALKSAFPSVKVGDIEPLALDANVLLRFASSFRSATGEPLSFIHADINWRSPWQQTLAAWKGALHQAGIRLGVIFNGDNDAASDQQWTDSAIERFRTVMADPTIAPDDAIFQSWALRPTKMIPDTDPYSMTGMLRRSRQ